MRSRRLCCIYVLSVVFLLTGCGMALTPEFVFSLEFAPAAEAVMPVTAEAHFADGEEIILRVDRPDKLSEKVELPGEGPQILIYHTHTTEAYRMAYEGEYEESSDWRTRDNGKNIVAVGEALKEELTALGYNVLHDTTDHEPPKLATSYSRSEVTMEEYALKYPSLKLYIDLHRDAADPEEDYDDVVVIDGVRCARVMCVVGMGTSKSVKNLKKPYFDENYALASAFCGELESYAHNFTRTIRIKPGRYNQHISDACMLIEVGHNAVTLAEAKNTVPYIARALASCLSVSS